MFLALIIFFSLKIIDTSWQAAPLPSLALDTRSDISCDVSSYAVQGRTVLDIIWSCLVTTVACTWVCVHPNVPFCKEDSWTILRRRAFLMFFSIIAPEFMVIWAFKQWRGAKMITKAVNEAFPDSRTFIDDNYLLFVLMSLDRTMDNDARPLLADGRFQSRHDSAGVLRYLFDYETCDGGR